MSPKRRLAVKKRGTLKATLKQIDPKLSLRQLSTMLRGSTTDGWKNDKIRRELMKKVDRYTPYGPLLVELRVPLIDGLPDLQWLVCNPFALLHIFVTESPSFRSLLLHSLVSSGDSYRGGLTLYCDETTPGNQKRHDLDNELQCVYWCIPQLPDWFRARKLGWFYYGFLRTGLQHTVQGDLSGLLRTALKHFYNPSGFNFEVGMLVSLMPGGGTALIKLDFMGFMQDEKALPNIFFDHHLFPSSQN